MREKTVGGWDQTHDSVVKRLWWSGKRTEMKKSRVRLPVKLTRRCFHLGHRAEAPRSFALFLLLEGDRRFAQIPNFDDCFGWIGVISYCNDKRLRLGQCLCQLSLLAFPLKTVGYRFRELAFPWLGIHGIVERKRYCPNDSVQRFRATFLIPTMPWQICC